MSSFSDFGWFSMGSGGASTILSAPMGSTREGRETVVGTYHAVCLPSFLCLLEQTSHVVSQRKP